MKHSYVSWQVPKEDFDFHAPYSDEVGGGCIIKSMTYFGLADEVYKLVTGDSMCRVYMCCLLQEDWISEDKDESTTCFESCPGWTEVYQEDLTFFDAAPNGEVLADLREGLKAFYGSDDTDGEVMRGI